MSDEQLDKERRRGWRLAVWVTPEETELIMARFASEHEVGEISPEAWAELGSTERSYATRCRDLEAVLTRVQTALAQTSPVLWKSLKAEVDRVLGFKANPQAK